MENEEVMEEEVMENEKRDERLAETLGKATEGLIEVGRLWAAHGLNVGRSALEASASTLRTTAGVLGALSDRFASEQEQMKEEKEEEEEKEKAA
jgi:hypothetical protein